MCEDLRLLAVVLRGACHVAQGGQRRAQVVQDDGHAGKRLREVNQVRQLRGEEPGVEDEVMLLQQLEALTKLGLLVHPRRRVEIALTHMDVMRGVAPDAAVVGARRLARHQQRLDFRAVGGQVGGADDAGGRAELAVLAGGELRRHALHKLHLTQRRHPRRVCVRLEESVRGDEDAVSDLVATTDEVVHELVRHVVLLLEDAKQVESLELPHVPNVVMWIHDLHLRLKCLFVHLLEPRQEGAAIRLPGLAETRELCHALWQRPLGRERVHHLGLLCDRECSKRRSKIIHRCRRD